MTGYDVFCICRKVMKRRKVSLDKYVESNQKNFYETLARFFVKSGMNLKDVSCYVRRSYYNDPTNFQPFDLMDENAQKTYKKWKQTESSKALYFQHVNEGFDFIENFCIKNNLTLDQYKNKFLKKHIRQEKIDYSIPVYMKMIDRRKLNRIDKLLLKKFLEEYNIVQIRIENPEFETLLHKRSLEMRRLIGGVSIK